jgi:DNA-binding MarR family transcriptional regulator
MKSSLPEREVSVAILRAAAKVTGELDELLTEYGLSEPQFNTLRILRGAGRKGLPTQQIAERLITRQPDITRLVDRLIDAGLVRRRRCEEDRRVVYVELTPAGRKLLARLDGPVDALHRRQFAHLSRGDVRALADLLGKLCAGSD